MNSQDLLAADTGMGAVTLRVADLDAMTAFYRDGVRLTVLVQEGARVVLGRPAAGGGVVSAGGTVPAGGDVPVGGTVLAGGAVPAGGALDVPVVVLEHEPALRHASPGQAGLFHTAVVFDDRADLAAALYSVATRYPQSFTGSADHLISNAFYFTDPEGNGVELYWDRDRTEWSWTHGSIDMDTVYIDPNAFLQEHLTPEALEHADARPGRVGHVHLSVGDVAAAKAFYVDTLGFATTAAMGSQALFVSAGGYHHHMAMNTWNSRGAGRRQQALGLGLVRIEVPAVDDLGALTTRMRDAGVQTADDGRTVAFEDPWANRIEVTTAGRG
ncbi:VOC family protein [Curtobacterium sp. CFBP9011]|uniref:VOC family protein n=1 Tax=Curtobacterium sp. CFBP9011 TaxID=3096530 RepID=UPI002A6A5E41|nr:VOC family protein [Curtobacterium sp. CFBP9011]MDY1005608.1 VOC family protein [Curtobacterium sp. CFBP9011]